MTVCECVAKRTKEIMKKKLISQYRLEVLTGIQHGAMDCILKCKNKGTEIATVAKIAQAFDMTLDEFFKSDIFAYDNMDVD